MKKKAEGASVLVTFHRDEGAVTLAALNRGKVGSIKINCNSSWKTNENGTIKL